MNRLLGGLAVTGIIAVGFAASAQDLNQQGRTLLDRIRAEVMTLEAEVLTAEQTVPAQGSEREALQEMADLRKQIVQSKADNALVRERTNIILGNITQLVSKVAVAKVAPVLGPITENTAENETHSGNASRSDQAPDPVVKFSTDRDTPLEVNGLPQRVLILPNAEIVRDPSDPDTRRAPLPVFSILYVFGEEMYLGNRWLAIGETQKDQDGWIQDFKTEQWQSMLVMRYARKSDRDRVLFFSKPDLIHDIIEDSFFGEREVDEIYSRIANSDYDPEKIIAIEPSSTVDDSEQVYLMPILAFEPGEFDDGTPTQILQLAGLNLKSEKRVEGLPPVPIDGAGEIDTSSLDELRVGIAFVIDTTTSMGPYITAAQDFVARIETGLNEIGVSEQFDIALVGYRDSLDPNEGVEYRTEVFRDFGATIFESASAQARRLEPSRVSTQDWREDAFAGLTDAINGLNWNEIQGRIVFLVTDASPRTVGDSLARDPSMGPATIAQMAEASDVTIYIMHMVSENAKRVSLSIDGIDDTAVGGRIYRQLNALGGDRVAYFMLLGDSANSFGARLEQVAQKLIPVLANATRGIAIKRESLTSSDAPLSEGIDPDMTLYSLSSDNVEIGDETEPGVIAGAVLSELFRQQQEFLGARNATEAPEFYRAWAADHDLSDSSLQSLDVSVLLTRAQLSDLTTRLEDLLEAMQNKEKGMGEFFAEVQDQSGRTLVDPNISTILPGYLSALPYVSKLLAVSAAEWDAMPPQSQGEFLDDVRAKVRGYREVAESQRNWYRLSDRKGGEDVYPLPLALLP